MGVAGIGRISTVSFPQKSGQSGFDWRPCAGGSTRFGDRSGQSQRERRVDRSDRSRARKAPERVYTSYLDVDEIVRGEMEEVPRPKQGRSGSRPKDASAFFDAGVTPAMFRRTSMDPAK
jgi:hypothetical protein